MTVVELPGGDRLLVACDAAGAIGPKPLDQVKVPGYVLGRFTARVPLMEVLAAGGRPLLLTNTCCVEPDPLGLEILRGIQEEAALVGLPPEAITGSFEKNVPTQQTGLGVTVIGVAERPFRAAGGGDLVLAVGRPKVGLEVTLDDPEIADLPLFQRLAASVHVHDLLPVGSRGIARELADMAASAGLTYELLDHEFGWDLNKSAGPSTSCLVAVSPAAFPALILTLTCPWALVARLY